MEYWRKHWKVFWELYDHNVWSNDVMLNKFLKRHLIYSKVIRHLTDWGINCVVVRLSWLLQAQILDQDKRLTSNSWKQYDFIQWQGQTFEQSGRGDSELLVQVEAIVHPCERISSVQELSLSETKLEFLARERAKWDNLSSVGIPSMIPFQN